MTDQVHGFTYGDFRWWNGVVEDRQDPLKIGRVKVRVFGYHSQSKEDVPTEALPWATVLQPTDSAGQGGVGVSPVGMQVGTHVMGYWADGDTAQLPIVIGVMLGAPSGKPDTNRLTRGEELSQTVVAKKNASVVVSTAQSLTGGLSVIQGVQAQISSVTDLVRSQTARLTSAMKDFTQLKFPAVAGLKIPDLNAPLRALQTSVDQVKGATNQVLSTANSIVTAAQTVVDEVTVEINNVKRAGEFIEGIGESVEIYKDELTNLPKNALQGVKSSVDDAKNAAKNMTNLTGNITGDLFTIQTSLTRLEQLKIEMPQINMPDPSRIFGQMNALQNSLNSLTKLTDTLAGLSQITALTGTIKGLSMSIPSAGAINGIISSMKVGVLSNTWTQPLSPAAPEYPLNRILETEGGLLEEFDSTPGSERYHRYHPTGTFIETMPDGSQSEKITKDRYTVILGDDCLHVTGDVKVNIIGNSNITVNGNATTQVNGNKTDIVTGDYTLAVMGSTTLATGLNTTIGSGVHTMLRAPRIDLN